MGKGKGKTLGKILLGIVVAMLVLALIAALLAWGYVHRMLGKIQRIPEESMLSPSEAEMLENTLPAREPGYTGPVYRPEDIAWPSEPPETIAGAHIINILLIGQDRRPGEPRQRSDAMILCTLNLDRQTVTLTSFLRDMYVKIPGYADNKINAAYQIGGMALLDQTLEVNFGIHVDGNVEVDFSQFQRIVDLMGGVDIELTAAEARYINSSIGTALNPGMNRLDGKAALMYSRIRYIGTDFGRTERQRTVLTALFEKCRNADISVLLPLLEEICTIVTTDMTNGEILDFVMDTVTVMDGLTVRSQRVPIDGSYYHGDINGRVSCIFVDFEANREMLLRTLMPEREN